MLLLRPEDCPANAAALITACMSSAPEQRPTAKGLPNTSPYMHAINFDSHAWCNAQLHALSRCCLPSLQEHQLSELVKMGAAINLNTCLTAHCCGLSEGVSRAEVVQGLLAMQ